MALTSILSSLMVSEGPNVRLFSNESAQTFQYYYHDIWDQMGDPRVNKFPLMSGGPWSVLGVIAAYVYFVKVIGPEFMSSRKPFSLKPLIFGYNVMMIIINAFFFITVSYFTRFGIATWHCLPIDHNVYDDEWQWKLLIGYLFVLSKFIDLFETIFFILRKNFRQVSALHVIHHSLVPINVWLGLKYVPSESAAFMPFINSFIHTVMYTYYALSSLGPQMKPFLWWKKYLTSMQIIQLALVSIHCMYLGLNSACNLPKVLFLLGFPQVILVLYMFCSFFIQSYSNNGQPDQNQNVTIKRNGPEKVKNS